MRILSYVTSQGSSGLNIPGFWPNLLALKSTVSMCKAVLHTDWFLLLTRRKYGRKQQQSKHERGEASVPEIPSVPVTAMLVFIP